MQGSPPSQFPVQQYNITPDGSVVFTTTLGPGLAITQVVGPDAMQDLVKQWGQVWREHKRAQDLAAEVLRTKNRQT